MTQFIFLKIEKYNKVPKTAAQWMPILSKLPNRFKL